MGKGNKCGRGENAEGAENGERAKMGKGLKQSFIFKIHNTIICLI